MNILTFVWSLMRMVIFSHKRDNFDFPILHFPYLSSNIPESPACGVFVSQLIRYARVCSKYEDFLFRGSILVSKLLKQGYYSSWKLQTTFRKVYGRYTDLIHKFDTSMPHMLNGLFTNRDIWLVSSYSWGVPLVGQQMHILSGTPDFTPFGEWIYSLYIHYILLNLSVLGLYLRINGGLFAWISLTALSRTHFIYALWRWLPCRWRFYHYMYMLCEALAAALLNFPWLAASLPTHAQAYKDKVILLVRVLLSN